MSGKTHYQQAKKVTLIGALINALLGVLKIVVGVWGHSQALVADGIHSLSDLITDALVLFAARARSHGPDADHPYGHGRFETLATVVLAVLLILIGLGIAIDAVEHIVTKADLRMPAYTVLFAAAISILANEFLYRYTLLVGNRIKSDLLRANAWHHRSDALSSFIVLLGALLTLLGLYWADALAAIIVSILIIRMGCRMAWRNVRELVDTGVDETTKAELEKVIAGLSGVAAVHQLRSRMLAGEIYLDVHVQVAPDISVSEGHYISEKVMAALYKQFQQITDITVHIDPEDDETVCPSFGLPDRQQLLQQLETAFADLPSWQQRLHIQLHYLNGELIINLLLPLSCIEGNAKDLEVQYQARLKKYHARYQLHLFFSTGI